MTSKIIFFIVGVTCLNRPPQSNAGNMKSISQCNFCYEKMNKDILQIRPDNKSVCWNSQNYSEVNNAIHLLKEHSDYIEIGTILVEIFKILIPCSDDACAVFKMFVEPDVNKTLTSESASQLYQFLENGGALQRRSQQQYNMPNEISDILLRLPGVTEPCLLKLISEFRLYVEENLFRNIIYSLWITTKNPNSARTTVTMTSKEQTKTTTETTSSSTTPQPVMCASCDGLQQCITNPQQESCEHNDLCYVTAVTQGFELTHFQKGCKSISACKREWLQQTSHSDDCLNIDNGLSGKDLTCTYCCTDSWCNSNASEIVPPNLYMSA